MAWKCRLDASVYNNKQCRCECKELIERQVCDKGLIWNPGNCECECDKASDVGDYSDYKNCICGKKIADKLVEEYSENEAIHNDYNNICSYHKVDVVLFVIVFLIIIGISCGFFFFFHCYFKRVARILLISILALKQEFAIK